MRSIVRFVALSVALLGASPELRAQQGARQPGAQAPAAPAATQQTQVDARLRALRMQVLVTEVGLDAKQAERVVQILEQYRPERQRLRQELATHRAHLRQLVVQDGAEDAAFTAALAAIRSAQAALQSVNDKQIADLGKLLSPKQQAKLLTSVQKLRYKIRGAALRPHASPAKGKAKGKAKGRGKP